MSTKKKGKKKCRNWGRDLETESSEAPKGKGEGWAKTGGMVKYLHKRKLGHSTPYPPQSGNYLILWTRFKIYKY